MLFLFAFLKWCKEAEERFVASINGKNEQETKGPTSVEELLANMPKKQKHIKKRKKKKIIIQN